MQKLVQSLLFLFLIVGSAYAQVKTITGTVTSKDDGLPMPSVSIKVKGTSVVSQTGSNGTYSIKYQQAARQFWCSAMLGMQVRKSMPVTEPQ